MPEKCYLRSVLWPFKWRHLLGTVISYWALYFIITRDNELSESQFFHEVNYYTFHLDRLHRALHSLLPVTVQLQSFIFFAAWFTIAMTVDVFIALWKRVEVESSLTVSSLFTLLLWTFLKFAELYVVQEGVQETNCGAFSSLRLFWTLCGAKMWMFAYLCRLGVRKGLLIVFSVLKFIAPEMKSFVKSFVVSLKTFGGELATQSAMVSSIRTLATGYGSCVSTWLISSKRYVDSMYGLTLRIGTAPLFLKVLEIGQDSARGLWRGLSSLQLMTLNFLGHHFLRPVGMHYESFLDRNRVLISAVLTSLGLSIVLDGGFHLLFSVRGQRTIWMSLSLPCLGTLLAFVLDTMTFCYGQRTSRGDFFWVTVIGSEERRLCDGDGFSQYAKLSVFLFSLIGHFLAKWGAEGLLRGVRWCAIRLYPSKKRDDDNEIFLEEQVKEMKPPTPNFTKNLLRRNQLKVTRLEKGRHHQQHFSEKIRSPSSRSPPPKPFDDPPNSHAYRRLSATLQEPMVLAGALPPPSPPARTLPAYSYPRGRENHPVAWSVRTEDFTAPHWHRMTPSTPIPQKRTSLGAERSGNIRRASGSHVFQENPKASGSYSVRRRNSAVEPALPPQRKTQIMEKPNNATSMRRNSLQQPSTSALKEGQSRATLSTGSSAGAVRRLRPPSEPPHPRREMETPLSLGVSRPSASAQRHRSVGMTSKMKGEKVFAPSAPPMKSRSGGSYLAKAQQSRLANGCALLPSGSALKRQGGLEGSGRPRRKMTAEFTEMQTSIMKLSEGKTESPRVDSEDSPFLMVSREDEEEAN